MQLLYVSTISHKEEDFGHTAGGKGGWGLRECRSMAWAKDHVCCYYSPIHAHLMVMISEKFRLVQLTQLYNSTRVSKFFHQGSRLGLPWKW